MSLRLIFVYSYTELLYRYLEYFGTSVLDVSIHESERSTL